jgi:siroheme synthase-like protein
MYYYPIFLNIAHKKCVVIGGGKVAERRIKELIKCRANVHIYAKKINKNITRLKKIKIHRNYSPALLKGAFLVFIATDDIDFNRKISREITKEKLLINVSDDPAHSLFIVPSIFRRGNLSIAISSGGKAPALARAIKKLLETLFGKEFILLINGIETLRRKVRKRLNKSAERIKILREGHLEELLKNLAGSNKKMVKRQIRNYLKRENRRIDKILRSLN